MGGRVQSTIMLFFKLLETVGRELDSPPGECDGLMSQLLSATFSSRWCLLDLSCKNKVVHMETITILNHIFL